MVKAHDRVSDLIFSPGRAPQIEVNGQLVELKYKGLECLTSQDTLTIANDIMGKNQRPSVSSNWKAPPTFPMASLEWPVSA